MTAPLQRLLDLSGVPESALPDLSRADAETLGRIEAATEALIAQEDAAVDEGIRSAVTIVPRPLRAVARNLLFGEDR